MILPFSALDGSSYSFINASSFSLEGWNQDFDTIYKFLEQSKQLKLVWDGNLGVNLAEEIQRNHKEITVTNYQTNFFYLQRNSIEQVLNQYPDADWNSYKNDFLYERIEPTDQKNAAIILDFMLESFGVDFVQESLEVRTSINSEKQSKILKNFHLTLSQSSLSAYLVKAKTDGSYVGCFCLISLEEEVQLHSVAGRASLKLADCKKLPILMAATVDIVRNDFKQGVLSFSNGKPKIPEIYESLGVVKNYERKGLILNLA